MSATPQQKARNPRVDQVAKRTPLRKSLNVSSIQLTNQDDDSERSNRRSMVHMQKKIMGTTKNADTSVLAGPDEIRYHIDICMKMFAENKITSKNAWNMRIIDYTDRFLELAGRDALQVGGTSLDVGAKVYSVRVDDIHCMGLKLAADMSKVDRTNEPKPNESMVEDEVGKKKPGATKKRRVFVLGGPKHTITKECSTLFGDIPQLESSTFQTSTNTDLSDVDNYFSNKVCVDKIGSCFTLMNNSEPFWPTAEDVDDLLCDKTFPLPIESVHFPLCPEFESFNVDEWDPNDDMERPSDTIHNTEIVFDEKGIPIAELDGSIHDQFDEPDMHSDDEPPMDDIAILGQVVNIEDMRPSAYNEADDYSFRPVSQAGSCITNIWAGPSHWKFKHLKRASIRYSGAVQHKQLQQKKKPKKKERPPIDFFAELEEQADDPKKEVVPLKPWPTINKFRMPMNSSAIVQCIQSMFLLPGEQMHEEGFGTDNKVDEDEGDNLADYAYDNANDSLYCPQNEVDATDDIVHEEDLPLAAQNQALTGENLIDLPEMVNANYVNYATRSKKMDMKKLKEKVWKVVVDPTEEISEQDDLYKMEVKEPITFGSIYKALPQTLNQSMKTELSSPLAFIAVLHLANEQNLKLTGSPDLRDFTIEQDYPDRDA